MEGGKKIPLLVEFLIENAAEIVPGFCSDNVFSVLHSVLFLNFEKINGLGRPEREYRLQPQLFRRRRDFSKNSDN